MRCRFTGTERRCINLGSYNYLGFAAPAGECADLAEAATRRYGLALASPRAELGSTPLHRELEETTARFLGVEVRAADHLLLRVIRRSLGKDALPPWSALCYGYLISECDLIDGFNVIGLM